MDTLVRDPYREALEAATGMDVRDLFELRARHAYPEFETGRRTEAEYWAVYADAGIDVDVDTFHRVRREGYAWVPGMAPLLDELAGAVHRVVASNYPHWVHDLREPYLDGRVEEIVVSHDLGVRKPDPAFYERLLDRLGLDPAEVAFVDDRPANVEAAEAIGMPAARFTDADDLRAWLRGHGVLDG